MFAGFKGTPKGKPHVFPWCGGSAKIDEPPICADWSTQGFGVKLGYVADLRHFEAMRGHYSYLPGNRIIPGFFVLEDS